MSWRGHLGKHLSKAEKIDMGIWRKSLQVGMRASAKTAGKALEHQGTKVKTTLISEHVNLQT